MKRLAFAVVLLTACARSSDGGPPTHQRAADRSVRLSGPSAAYVRVEPAARASGVQSRGFVGQVSFDERHVARLGSPVQGRVARVLVVPGDTVKAGDVVVTIHAPDIATAQAAVAQAQTARGIAQRALDRAQLLVTEGAGTEAERQQAEAALAQAKSEEQRAVATLTALGGAAGTSDYALRSPIDGAVIERDVAVGKVVHVDQDQPLLVIADVSTVWVLADVFEQDLARVHAGDEAAVEVQSFPGRTFQGAVTHLAGALDPTTRVARARIELANADHALRPGMFARVAIKGVADAATQVPSAAVLSRRDEFFVFVQREDGAFVERKVRIGEQRGAHTTILEGLEPGERVVIEGAILLDAEINESL